MKKICFAILCYLTSVGALARPFNYCTEAGPSFFNPQLATDGATFNATRTIYSRLVQFELGGIKIKPMLAKSWKLSANGKTLDINLRNDVVWHSRNGFVPTRKLNADDILFSFSRMSDPSNPYHNINGGKYKYFNSMDMKNIIDRIEKLDDHNLRFHLKRPEATILPNLAMDFASILSKEYADYLIKKKKMNDLDSQPVGSGPFQFVSYEKDKLITFKANESYFEGAPKIKDLLFKIITDSELRLEMLFKKECDLVVSPPPSRLAEIRANPMTRVMSQPGLNIFYIAFNTQRKPFDNVLVRRAISHAINRERIVDKVFGGHAQLAKNPIPPTMWSYNRKTQDFEYNQEKALKLLAQAGIERGTPLELSYMIEARPYNPNGKKVAELMKQDLESVGFKVELKTKEWTQYLKSAYLGDFDLLQAGWTGDNGDPDNFLNLLLSCNGVDGGNNYSRWCDKRYSHYIGRARVTTNLRKRTNFYEKAQEIFKQEAPWVTMAHATVYKAMLKSVTGYKMTPFGHDIFTSVSLKDQEKK